jgi:hypothetical protein
MFLPCKFNDLVTPRGAPATDLFAQNCPKHPVSRASKMSPAPSLITWCAAKAMSYMLIDHMLFRRLCVNFPAALQAESSLSSLAF